MAKPVLKKLPLQKLAVCILNQKGGVGKTTAALIMAQTAALTAKKTGKHVLCIDLDEQKNLTEAMKLVSEQFSPFITLTDCLEDGYATSDFDLFVLDCPPRLDTLTASAVAFADIVLVPVQPGLFGVMNLPVVWNFIMNQGKRSSQIALIKNGFDGAQATKFANAQLNNKGYHVAGELPRYAFIPNNIFAGRPWWAGMTASQVTPFVDFYNKVLEAWKQLQACNFKNTWK